MSEAGVELAEIDFRGDWREFAGSVDLKGCRVVGVATFRHEGRLRQGTLTRRSTTRAYQLWGSFGVIALDQDETERFLQRIRRGYHGGPGRCQGKMTDDGYSYPLETSMTLPPDVVRWATRFGGGVFSIGVRRMVASAMERRATGAADLFGDIAQAPPVRSSAAGKQRKAKTKAYLDHQSLARLRDLGDGNVSKGVRVAHSILSS